MDEQIDHHHQDVIGLEERIECLEAANAVYCIQLELMEPRLCCCNSKVLPSAVPASQDPSSPPPACPEGSVVPIPTLIQTKHS